MSHEVKSRTAIRRHAAQAAETDDRNGTKTPCPYNSEDFKAEWFDAYADRLMDLFGENSI